MTTMTAGTGIPTVRIPPPDEDYDEAPTVITSRQELRHGAYAEALDSVEAALFMHGINIEFLPRIRTGPADSIDYRRQDGRLFASWYCHLAQWSFPFSNREMAAQSLVQAHAALVSGRE